MFIRFRKKPFHHRGTPTHQKGPCILICPREYSPKIKKETSPLRRGFFDYHGPPLHIARGEETTRVGKRKTSGRFWAPARLLITPTPTPMHDHKSPQNPKNLIFPRGAAPGGGEHCREAGREEGRGPPSKKLLIHQLNPRGKTRAP
ncbi:hypothetical protein JTE90_000422 [Oedothorax gibbosus]|uniref:Uncharacterized protein n=1 Tax=Oedothorax gibbosus TaxID=931172 RepID=A0AAV6TD21_9ARAC|nr:hypothetical protein JTE90_000422 [Oedothorax gibbosus]